MSNSRGGLEPEIIRSGSLKGKKEGWWIGMLDKNHSGIPDSHLSLHKKNTELKKQTKKLDQSQNQSYFFDVFSVIRLLDHLHYFSFFLFYFLKMGPSVAFSQTRHGDLKASNICGSGPLLSNIVPRKQRSPWWQQCSYDFWHAETQNKHNNWARVCCKTILTPWTKHSTLQKPQALKESCRDVMQCTKT